MDPSSIGGVVMVQLVDDGTNGDQTAGDLVFSRIVTVAASTTAGTRTLGAGVIDAQSRTASAFFSLTVNVSGVVSTPPTAVLNSGPFGRLSTAHVSAFVTPGANPASTGLRVVLNLTPLGGGAATELSNAGGALCDYAAGDATFTACLQLPPSVQAGPIVLTGTVSDAQGRSSALSFNTSVTAGTDSDGDGLLDSFEGCFGLDLNSGAGDNGPSGDPDGDGLTNLQEQSAGTHPRGFFTRYLAEGATNAFFQTRVGLFDIGSPQGSTTNIRLQPEGLPERSFCTIVPRLGRRTLTPEDTITYASGPFATVVESNPRARRGPHHDVGAGLVRESRRDRRGGAASTTWTLAEGATGWRFSLFYLLQNPSNQAADVEVNYLRSASEPVLTRVYTVAARAQGAGRSRSMTSSSPAGSGSARSPRPTSRPASP